MRECGHKGRAVTHVACRARSVLCAARMQKLRKEGSISMQNNWAVYHPHHATCIPVKLVTLRQHKLGYQDGFQA